MDRNALTSRIDRLEGLLLSVMKNTTNNSALTPPDGVPEIPNASKGRNDDSKGYTAQIEEDNMSESVDVELLGKELGVLRVEPTQTRYHGGQHWVSTMMQV